MRADEARKIANAVNNESMTTKAFRAIMEAIEAEAKRGQMHVRKDIFIPLPKESRKELWEEFISIGYLAHSNDNMCVIRKTESDRFDNWKVDVGFSISIEW